MLYTSTVNDDNIEISPQPLKNTRFTIFGVRACDARGLEILDLVYLSDPVDSFYANRRNNATVITLACEKPNVTCLCNTFDIDHTHPAGDISTWLTETELYWKAHTEKGERLTAALANILEETHGIAKQTRNNESLKFPLDSFDSKNLLEIFNAPQWDELYKTCIACGTCTYICPTCQCYDIGSFNTGQTTKHHRCLDSCMFADFTQMAHGNPRPSHKERFRQRFMHKLVYGNGCVGCGRCVSKCPVNMSIVKIIRAFAGKG